VAAHDTTGGMESKIAEAAIIAKLGIDVYITKVSMLSCSPSIVSFPGMIHLEQG
jgi:glutamate 5-kinase